MNVCKNPNHMLTKIKPIPQPRPQPGFSPKPARPIRRAILAEDSPMPDTESPAPDGSPIPMALSRRKQGR